MGTLGEEAATLFLASPGCSNFQRLQPSPFTKLVCDLKVRQEIKDTSYASVLATRLRIFLNNTYDQKIFTAWGFLLHRRK